MDVLMSEIVATVFHAVQARCPIGSSLSSSGTSRRRGVDTAPDCNYVAKWGIPLSFDCEVVGLRLFCRVDTVRDVRNMFFCA